MAIVRPLFRELFELRFGIAIEEIENLFLNTAARDAWPRIGHPLACIGVHHIEAILSGDSY
jgi:hypothetical protein